MTPVNTLLEELTRDFPAEIKLKVREALDRTRIRNPDDPVFELMIVLSLWAKYYETIPAQMRKAGQEVGVQNEHMLSSLDERLALLKSLAQAVQKAVDQLEGAPRAIVEKFPAEGLAKSIAGKLDARFQELPLIQLEKSVASLHRTIKDFVEHPGGDEQAPSVAERMRRDVARLEQSAGVLKNMNFPHRASPARDALFILVGGFLVFIFLKVYPDWMTLKNTNEWVRSEAFITHHVLTGTLEGRPVIVLGKEDFKNRVERADDVVIYLDRLP